MNEQEMQQKLIVLRGFYMQFIRYVGINFVGVFLWMLSGGGYFWPIWVMILWGADLAYQANKLDLFKNKQHYKNKLFDLSKKWEEEHITQLKKSNKK